MKQMKQIGSMSRGIFLSFIFLLLVSSLESQEVKTVNPVGKYEFTTVDDGQSFTADVVVEGEPGKYKGTIKRRDKDISINFTDVGVSSGNMIIVADVRSSVFVLRLYFSGDTFTGSWAMGAEGSEIKGKRIQSQ